MSHVLADVVTQRSVGILSKGPASLCAARNSEKYQPESSQNVRSPRWYARQMDVEVTPVNQRRITNSALRGSHSTTTMTLGSGTESKGWGAMSAVASNQ